MQGEGGVDGGTLPPGSQSGSRPVPRPHCSPRPACWVQGEELPFSRRRVNGSATELAAVTRTRGSAAGTAALCQASKGSPARRGNTGLALFGAAYTAPFCATCCLQGVCCPAHPGKLSAMLVATGGHEGMVAPVKHPPLPEGWTWPWVCRGAHGPGGQGAHGPGGHLRSGVCVTWSGSGWHRVSWCPTGAVLAVE